MNKMDNVEKCIAWAMQQGYFNAEETAKELGKVTGRTMRLDQAYYDNYKWHAEDEICQSCDQVNCNCICCEKE